MRILWLTLGVAGLASAQCYQFSGPGFNYTMNIMSVSVSLPTPSLGLMQFIVQQQSTLTLGGTTYVGAVGPANLTFQSEGGVSTMMTASINILTEPVWQAGVFLVGNLSFLPGSPPASLPPISAWQVQTPFLGESVNGGAENKLTITFVGSCSGSTGTGTGTGSTSVSGQSLGDTSSNPGSCNCDDPIDLGSGNLFLKRRDYQTAGPNPLSFVRYYNSLGDPNSLATTLGPRWRSNFDRYLQLSASSVTAERPDGSEVTFTLTGSAWTTDTDIDVKLTNSGTTWTLVDKNDTVETYTATGATKALLQTIQARNGYTQTMQYNGANLLSSITDSYNRQLTLAYQNNLLQSVTTPEALVITFAYATGELSSAQFSTSPATTESYLYENSALPNNLTGIVDENGSRYLTWTYDSKGRALTGQLAGGADLNTIVYNDNDGSRMVTGPLGLQELYKFNTLQNVPKVIEVDRLAGPTVIASTRTFSYDTNGYVASTTDWNGNTTTFVNDAHGQPTNIVQAAGTPQARTTQITYHPTFHLPVQVVSTGLNIGFTYDSSGELLTKTLTDTSTTSTPYSTNGQTRTWTFTWSNFLLASAKSPRSDLTSVTGFGYDSTGALTSVTNALNQITQITQHTAGGRPLTIIDANGVQTSLAYDGRQRLISSTINTAAGALSTKLTYDSAGNLLTVTQPDGSALTYSYDAAHRIVGASDLLGEKLLVTLDANGDRAQTIAQDSSGSTHFTRTGAYDALGRITQITAGAGQVTTFSYDSNGNLVTTADPLKHATQAAFDALNRVAKITNAAQGVTAIAYDLQSRPLSRTSPAGVTTQYIYDGFGELIEESSPTTGTAVFRYDPDGNPVQRTDGRGVVSNIAYDALDRRISIVYPGNPAENVTLSYDQGTFGIGRLTSVVDAAGTLSRTYDERGNMLTESRTRGAATLNSVYTYDAASHVASITYPSRWSVAYSRDKMGRITGVSAAQGSGAVKAVVSGVAYQPFGPISALTFGNGITEARSFDQDYRLTSLAATVEKLTYGYDAANNVLSVTDGVNSGNNQSFGYDPLNRLATASGSYGALGYTYDPDGNRLTESSPATGDGLGSIASFTYNQAGRLASTSTPNQQLTQYTYDAFGHRLVKAGQATGTTLYQYSLSGPLLEETDGNGNPQVDYIYLNGRPIATIQASNGAIYFLHDDRQGTPQAATDSTQSVVWSASYQPFGQSSNAPATITQNLRLPGQESDLETGFNHNGFRNYIPAWGRYLESDPIGLVGGMNRYAYTSGNPLKSIDPLGLCELGDWIKDQIEELFQPSVETQTQLVGVEESSATAAALEAKAAFGEAAAAFELGGIIEKDVAHQVYNAINDADPSFFPLYFPQSQEQFELVVQFSDAELKLLNNPPPAVQPGPSPLAPIPATGLTVMWNPKTLRDDLFDQDTQMFVPWVQ